MKRIQLVACVLVAVALFFAGCGKSDEFKKLEAGLNTELMQKHDDLMKAMSGLDAAAERITSVIAQHDSLAKLFPKELAGHDIADLTAAKAKLDAAKGAMMGWMKGFKPFDPTGKHEEVMAQLQKSKDELSAVSRQFEEALSTAKAAVETHTKFAEELAAAKMSKKKK
jgi:hypothetical protein